MIGEVQHIKQKSVLSLEGFHVFAFRTALIICGIDSTKCWKHSSEILTASHPKGALLD